MCVMMYGWIMMMAQCTSRMLLSLLNLFYNTGKTGIDTHQSTCFCHEMVHKTSPLLMKKHINNQATHQSILCPTPLFVSHLLLLLLPIAVSALLSSSSSTIWGFFFFFFFFFPLGFLLCFPRRICKLLCPCGVLHCF